MKAELLAGLLLSPLSPFIPLLAGLIRLRKIAPAYYPLIAVFGCAFLAEGFRFIQLYNYYAVLGLPVGLSLIPYNLYVLAIGVLYCILFYNFGLFSGRKVYLYLIIGVLVLLWVWEHLLSNPANLHNPTRMYRLFYSLVLCLFSIHHLNTLIVGERRNLLKNASFLVCICILLFFLPYIITEGAFLFSPKSSREFLDAVFQTRLWLNPIVYLIFTLAVIWIPPKKPFIQLS